MSALVVLRKRLAVVESERASLLQQIKEAERDERTITEHAAAWSKIVRPTPDKVTRFLVANLGRSFTASEIMRATNSHEDATRKALTRLAGDGSIDRVSHGRYTAKGAR